LVSTEAGFVIRETQNVEFDVSRTCDQLCAKLREFPDADVKAAAGSQFVDLVVPRLSKAPPALCYSDDDDDDTSESNPPYPLVPHVSTSDNKSSLLGKSADEEQRASEGQSVPDLVEPEVADEMDSDPGAEVGGERARNVSVGGQNESDAVSESGESADRRYPKRNRKAINKPYDAYLYLSGVERKAP
jgi:hypothetical protein